MSTADNVAYIEELYALWRKDPLSVPAEWRDFFQHDAQQAETPPAPAVPARTSGKADRQCCVSNLLWAYRDVGYMYARLNPLGGDFPPDHTYLKRKRRGSYDKLTLEHFRMSPGDLDTEFFSGRAMKPSRAPLREIIEAFRQTYCSYVGVEFLHIQERRMRGWMIDKMESTRNTTVFEPSQQATILKDLIYTEEFERFLGAYFVGEKRFSLEGSEVVVPALHYLVDTGARANDIDHIVIGTTHRGRLSILRAVFDMSPEEILAEFEENFCEGMAYGEGDVKYHIGYETDHVNPDGSRVHMSMPANPSHLEAISSVVLGNVRALQDRRAGRPVSSVLPLLIHGDAAFAGQGVVAETLNLSQLEGYTTGGTVHIVINNQIGFTTSMTSGRSSAFPTDVAKMLPIPIFHVNGDQPEAVVHAMKLAIEFRQTFKEDAIVDVFCFRRHGHSEGDDPSFTHPRMYSIVKNHPGVASLYGDFCDRNGVMSREEQSKRRAEFQNDIKKALEKTRAACVVPRRPSQGKEWEGISRSYSGERVRTGVSKEVLVKIADRLLSVPDGMHVHAKLRRILEAKVKSLREAAKVDWSLAESLAFGSLLLEGNPVRLSGEDSTRGTFSQRHLVWWDTESEAPSSNAPLANLGGKQAVIWAYDSPLSEYSILAFEYGYSLVDPGTLTIWEAQFGDFSNGAQVIIDNFIASAETKWGQRSGLVLLLPHGQEGQGPDHSNARVERFLQLSARENMMVCNPTTPAQYFHLLRRQVRASFRKPLIIFTPKSLLRHPMVVSGMEELSTGMFEEVIDDTADHRDASRVLLSSGKVYYDLLSRRGEAPGPVALVRVEQLYPFPGKRLREVLNRYKASPEMVWVQEENKNAGAWGFIRERFPEVSSGLKLAYAGREESGSSATGSLKQYRKEQEALVKSALGIV